MIIHKGSLKPDYIQIKRYLPPEPEKNKKITMSDIVFVIICTLILSGLTKTTERALTQLFPPVAHAQAPTKIAPIVPTPTPRTVIKFLDIKNDTRAARLASYLRMKNSPLADYAGYIIKRSDEEGIDWTLMVAISGKESTYGTNTNQNCHNPFGLGGRKFMCFSSWQDVIDFEANLLSEDYRLNMVSGIQPKYCPSFECASDWTSEVVRVSGELLK